MKRALNIYKLLCYCLLLVFVLSTNSSVALAQGPVRIFFLHHSTGHNLIEGGGVREMFTELGYEFYDHGYNDDGLRLADGSYTGTNFDVPGDNTDPDGFADIFAQPLHDPPDNTFSHMMQYDVIAFKSCFPTSNIGSEDQLNEYKSYYLSIRDRIDQYPEKIFIVVTPPPQVPGATDASEATRARAFANWLKSDEYLSGHPNIFTFDFFNLLAGEDNMLRPEYRVDDYDAHPNDVANRTIGPLFVEFIDGAIQSYYAGGTRPEQPVAPESPSEGDTEQPSDEEVESQPPAAPSAASGLIDDFEATTEPWHASSNSSDSVIECGADREFAYEGGASLRIHYDIAPSGWVDCGQAFEMKQDWSGGSALSFWLLADSVGQWGTLMLFSGTPDNPTPFEVDFETTDESTEGWVQHVIPWSNFNRAEWADEGGLSVLDLSQITGYGFSFGANGEGREGIIWLDNLGLADGEDRPDVSDEDEEQPPSDMASEETSQADADEEEGNGGVCPFATIGLPLGAISIVWVNRRRR